MGVPSGRANGGGPAYCLGRSIKELQERPAGTESGVCQFQKRDTEAQSVQAGQESSLDDSDGFDVVVTLELTVDLIGNTSEFQRADGTQVVDQEDKLIVGFVCKEGAVRIVVVQDLQKHGLDQLRKSSLDAVRSRLVVNAHSNLDFTIGN